MPPGSLCHKAGSVGGQTGDGANRPLARIVPLGGRPPCSDSQMSFSWYPFGFALNTSMSRLPGAKLKTISPRTLPTFFCATHIIHSVFLSDAAPRPAVSAARACVRGGGGVRGMGRGQCRLWAEACAPAQARGGSWAARLAAHRHMFQPLMRRMLIPALRHAFPGSPPAFLPLLSLQ